MMERGENPFEAFGNPINLTQTLASVPPTGTNCVMREDVTLLLAYSVP
ncbi:MAG: hypothetical protein AAF702_29800 [Chloroflexota bacterium]